MGETVKLIIEIPKFIYEDLKLGKIYSSLCEAPQGLVEGIRNGIPLDDVKEKIAKLRLIGYADALGKYETASRAVMDVLDNIGKGE